VHCWGNNDVGQLGNGGIDFSAAIGQPIAGATDWTDIAAGEDRSCGIRGAGGQLYCWGDGEHGALGHGASLRWEPHGVSHP
jgi:alpha-tubulin suppressor-like RCC1 family protein